MRYILLLIVIFQAFFINSNATSRKSELKEVVEESKPKNPQHHCRPGACSHSISLIHVSSHQVQTIQEGDSGKPAFDHKGKKPESNNHNEQKSSVKPGSLKA